LQKIDCVKSKDIYSNLNASFNTLMWTHVILQSFM